MIRCQINQMQENYEVTGNKLIRSLLEHIPTLPGIYKMLNANKEVIYVGKAKNLKKRLANYIHLDLDRKTLRLVAMTNYLEYSVTNSEVEALLLEAQLIKKFQPKFNILLKDDKTFPYIKLRTDSDYPQLIKYRGRNLSNGDFFGPFASSEQVDTTLKELQKIFKLRSCSDSYFANRIRPCLQYQIGRCSAPCVGKISKEDYADLVSQTKDFLEGRTNELQDILSKKMESLSAQLRFEEAADLRDRIKALSYIQLKSNSSAKSVKNADILAIVERNSHYCIELYLYRAGQSCGNNAYFPLNTDNSDKAEILTQFISQFYQANQIPDEIILNHPVIDLELLTKAIRQLGNNKLIFTFPSRGDKVKLVENAEMNANLALEHHLRQFAKNQIVLKQVQELFGLSDLPERIEIYDNSHIMGSFAVGSMVVANQSGFDKKEYRIFNISISLGDDYEMLRHVLTRRFKRVKIEPFKVPSLMIIDGGKGHLAVVKKVMAEFDLDIPFVCMSKGPDRNAGYEQFHMIDKDPFTLDKNLPLMKYLQILRDEAHNYAIKNHRLKRSRAIKISSLDDISSIGEVRRKALLHYFGSYKAVCEATIDELLKVNGINQKIAKIIFDTIHQS